MDSPNELDIIVVGGNNLFLKNTKNNPVLAMYRIEPSRWDSFHFVDMLKIESCEFSISLDVKLDVNCVHNSIALGHNDVEFCVCL